MEPWVLTAREQIRDLIARYNANGDTGRFAQVLELFAPDAVMELPGGRTERGARGILTIFTGAQDRASSTTPTYLRHMTSTEQIDLVDEQQANGRCYYQVLTAVGLDHWGRYIDRYRVVEGRWLFAHRTVTIDGQSPDSVMVAPA
jgi:hypothetical protein